MDGLKNLQTTLKKKCNIKKGFLNLYNNTVGLFEFCLFSFSDINKNYFTESFKLKLDVSLIFFMIAVTSLIWGSIPGGAGVGPQCLN